MPSYRLFRVNSTRLPAITRGIINSIFLLDFFQVWSIFRIDIIPLQLPLLHPWSVSSMRKYHLSWNGGGMLKIKVKTLDNNFTYPWCKLSKFVPYSGYTGTVHLEQACLDLDSSTWPDHLKNFLWQYPLDFWPFLGLTLFHFSSLHCTQEVSPASFELK